MRTPIIPATHGKHHGLDEELSDDVLFLARTERAAHADLTGALGDGGEHDVHDADATDDKRDGGDGAEHDVEDFLGLLFGLTCSN